MTLEAGQNVLLNVEEELRQELEPAQTLLRQTEDLTVKETVLKRGTVTLTNVKVSLLIFISANNIDSLFIVFFSSNTELLSEKFKFPCFRLDTSRAWCRSKL